MTNKMKTTIPSNNPPSIFISLPYCCSEVDEHVGIYTDCVNNLFPSPNLPQSLKHNRSPSFFFCFFFRQHQSSLTEHRVARQSTPDKLTQLSTGLWRTVDCDKHSWGQGLQQSTMCSKSHKLTEIQQLQQQHFNDSIIWNSHKIKTAEKKNPD